MAKVYCKGCKYLKEDKFFRCMHVDNIVVKDDSYESYTFQQIIERANENNNCKLKIG